jgi:hypothetical protein
MRIEKGGRRAELDARSLRGRAGGEQAVGAQISE